jgi:ADP-heptose:LPS heptosyltransferase
MPPPQAPRRILIVRTGAIGDVANALVLASALKRGLAGAQIGWVVHPLAAPLVSGHPDVDRVHLWRRGQGWAGLRALLGELRSARYDTAIDLQRLQKSALLARLCGAPRVVGFERRRTKECSWVWTKERIAAGPPQTHMLDTYLRMAAHFVAAPAAERRLPMDPSAEAWAAARLAEFGAPPLLLNLGATKAANRWEPERFGRLAAARAGRGLGPLALIGGPADREAAQGALAAGAGASGAVDLVGRTDLPQLIALLRRARLFVGCDTGPMHLAAAVGCPVLALFGAADERRTGPYGEDRRGRRHLVLRETPPCAPCGKRVCPLPRHACMLDLEVERVAAAALQHA